MTDLTARSGAPGAISMPVAAMSAILSLGAAATHALVVPEHMREYRLFGCFFVAVTVAQLVWAGAVLRWPTRTSYLLGALGSASLIGLWTLSRSVGLPLGPQPWQPEAVGTLDVTCALLEVGIVALAVVAVRPGTNMHQSTNEDLHRQHR